MLKQFPLLLDEAGAASWFNIFNLDIINGDPAVAITLSVLFPVSLFASWWRLCQGQATCAQSEVLVYTYSPTGWPKSPRTLYF